MIVERIFAGLGAFVFSIATAALLIAFLLSFFSLLTTGAIMGWAPPIDAPTWLVLVLVCILYGTLTMSIFVVSFTSSIDS